MERFEFVIEPWTYLGPRGSEEKILKIKVWIDGKKWERQVPLRGQQPFINEIELYAEMAVKTLVEELKHADK